MDAEEARNLCPDCDGLVPLGDATCPHCGRRFRPRHSNLFTLCAQCWRLWNKCSGRAPLQEFHAFTLPHLLVFGWSCFYLVNALGAAPWGEHGWGSVLTAMDKEPAFYALYAYLAVALVPTFSLCCRRLHDSDRDFSDLYEEFKDILEEYWLGIYFFRAFFPLVCMLVHLPQLLFFEDSTPGPNRFGPATRYRRFQDAPTPNHPFN